MVGVVGLVEVVEDFGFSAMNFDELFCKDGGIDKLLAGCWGCNLGR